MNKNKFIIPIAHAIVSGIITFFVTIMVFDIETLSASENRKTYVEQIDQTSFKVNFKNGPILSLSGNIYHDGKHLGYVSGSVAGHDDHGVFKIQTPVPAGSTLVLHTTTFSDSTIDWSKACGAY